MKRTSRFRSTFIFWILTFGFIAVIARSFQLQLHPHNRLTRMAKEKFKLSQQQQAEDLITSRGAIIDREGRDLALSLVVKSFFANPKQIKNPQQVANRLAPLLQMSSSKLAQLLKQDRYFVWLKREVDENTSTKIESLAIDGIYSKKESKRLYPQGELARSVLGISGVDGVGLEGIEKQYDEYLRSSDKASGSGIRDALGRLLLFDDFEREWFESHHVVSTIDIRLQRIMEEELRATLHDKDAKSAQAILMNPKTGEILAMASLDGKRGEQKPLRNRTISDVYEPGSTFKIILAASSLENLKMTPQSQIYGEDGMLRVGNHTIKEFHGHKFKWLTLQELLEVSSNVASAKLGLKLGATVFDSTIRTLGFGKATSIDLPGEATGLLRNASSWKPIELANISFGQGVAVTPLQMVRAVAAVANGGYLVQPYVVSKVVAPKTTQAEPQVIWQPTLEKTEVLSAGEAKTLTDMLIHVTDKGSTGVEAGIEGYQIAGKTGTSQKLTEEINRKGKKYKTYTLDKSLVSFVGYVPAYDPAFVLLVVYDEPMGRTTGGNTAAPSFRRIASRSLAVLGIPTQRFERKTESRLEAKVDDAQGRFVGKSFQDVLREVKDLPQEQRAKIDLIGFGTAIREEVDAEQRTRVYFK
ncbi:MAG: penicillin-binding protein 2 [Deltaproteobacteria bacterium]|nr:penicillin-binding protein 2 [Deltaproteobacteria bacterium]